MKIKTTHICVTDFEATCWEDKRGPNDTRVNEIIEVGSAMVSLQSMAIVDTYQRFVKPAQSEELSGFCTSLTSITNEDIRLASEFPLVLESWKSWAWRTAGDSLGGVLFASWGLYDYRQLIKDCAYHVLPFPFRGDHLNLKEYVSAKMGWSKKGCGMGKAINRLGMKFEGTHHRGIDDAKMAAKVLLKVGHDDAAYANGYRPSAHEVFLGYNNG